MIMLTKQKLLSLAAVLMFAPVLLVGVAQAGEERRAPPQSRSAGTLSEPVMRAITEISELMSPEDEDDEPDLVRAKEELDQLRERRFERMNDFEKSTLLNFYTNYYLTTDNIPMAIQTFQEVLTIEELREDTRLRALRSLGQLQGAEENWSESVNYYQQWRDLSLEEDDIVFRGLAYAHYQQEQFAESLPHWLSYMQMTADAGGEISRNDYSFLFGLYVSLEDNDNALNVTKTMIVKFDDPSDWNNLAGLYSNLDDDEKRIGSMVISQLKGNFDSDTYFQSLGGSLAGSELPYNGAHIMEQGFEQGILEEELDNYTNLAQMYMISSEFEAAIESATAAAELDPSGDGYDNLGYVYYQLKDYQASADAFKQAVDKGDLRDRAGTLLFYARALFELDEYDEAIAVARQSAEAGDERDQTSANSYVRMVEGKKTWASTVARNKAAAIDFYQGYPSLQ